VPATQAEAFADAFRDAQGEADFATKADIAAVRADLRELERLMKADLRETELRLTIKLGALMAVATGLVAALVKLL
jgi:hypothetical protein